jgi:beta-lactamase regulating signal transducer with metallopeptidase domain
MIDFFIIFFKKIIYLNLNLLFSIGFAYLIIKCVRIKNPSVRYVIWGMVIVRFIYDSIFYKSSNLILENLPKHGGISIGIGLLSENLKTIFASLWFNNIYGNIDASCGDILSTLLGFEKTLYISFFIFIIGVYFFIRTLLQYILFLKTLKTTFVLYDNIDNVTIYLSDLINTPFVIGIFRPVIVLPLSLNHCCTEDELRVIINHEFIHIKRRDHIIFALLSFMKSLFIVIFPLHIAINKLEEAEEQICDNMVLERGEKKKTIANAIIKLLEFQFLLNQNPAFSSVPKFSTDKCVIENRLSNIYSINQKKYRLLNIPVYIFSFILVFGCSIF